MLALVVEVVTANVEIVSDQLWALGVVAIEERQGATDGVLELWTSLGEDAVAATRAADRLTSVQSWRFESIDDSVTDTWRAAASPTWVDRDVVVWPAWQERPHGTGSAIVEIAIEPGATFGLGNHPTTVLTLRAMRAALRPAESVLDVGCGSGILAIAACLLGAHHADGIDVSPAAVVVGRANASNNGVGGRVRITNTPLAEVPGPYDVVVANILAPTLIELAADLVRVVAARGRLVVSGLLAGRYEHVAAALVPLRVVRCDEMDGWVAITLER